MTEHEIFVHSLELSNPGARKEYVDRSCGDDRRLWQRVNDLLEAHERASGFLQTPVLSAPAKQDADPIQEKPGTVIGPYKLLQLIGEGGFGVVYMAEQTEPMRRKVALKVIKPGMDTKAVVARFESERQALALMEHPNIARVLDAGTTATGRPYFVMELVKGVPITEFCDKNNLPIEQRLQLFMEVCRAVQHAHHKGVIHRDLKPSNVMVTLHDGRPVPKVIDFGVAKATSQQLTQGTLFTAYGQMIGTPVYMSPEQAEMSGLDIDTRSDIYSLGVLLYELLTGTTPLEIQKLREAGLMEMQRLIREEVTQRPSTRLSTLGERATVLANQRGTDAKRLSHFLNGDLDWIVMKSLEKDRRRRYDTPNDFAEDVQRFLNHEAIVARPPSAVYRIQKFCSRNRRTVAAVAALATALLLGTIASTWQAIRATNAEHQALSARAAEAQQRAEAVKERDEAQRLQRETQSLNDQLKQAAAEQRRAIYATEMNLVRIEAQRGNLPRMRELLMEQLPTKGGVDLRGFEWTYWYRFLNQAQVLKRFDGFRFGQRGSALAIAPEGKVVAVTRADKTEFQELSSGRVIGTAPFELRNFVNRTRLAANGRAVVGPANSNVAFWLGSAQPVRSSGATVFEPSGDKTTFEFPAQAINHVSFLQINRDGRFVAALGNDVTHEREKPACRLLVWNSASGELVLNKLEHRELNRMEFSRDGNRLVAYVCHSTKRNSDETREVAIVVDIPSGEVQAVARHNDDVDCVFWLPDGHRVLMSTLGYSGSSRKELLTWSLDEEVPRRLSNEYMPDYVKGDISPDGKQFAVSGHTVSAIRLIDTTNGQVIRTLHNEATTIDTLTFSDDGERLVACSTSGEVLSWDLGQQDDLFKLRSNPLQNVRYLTHAVSEDLSLMAIANIDGRIHVRARDGQETVLQVTPTQASAPRPILLISPDSKRLAFSAVRVPGGRRSSGSQLVEMYDVASATRLWRIERDQVSPNRSLEFTPDSRQLIVAGFNETFTIDCNTGEMKQTPNPGGRLFVSRSLVKQFPTGRVLQLARCRVSERRSLIRLQDALTGEIVAEADAPEQASSIIPQMIPAPDGRHFGLLPENSNRAEVWDLIDQRLVVATTGDRIVFSRDGNQVAVAESEVLPVAAAGLASGESRALGKINVWDIADGRLLSTISLAGNHADEIRFSPDNRRLVTLHGKRANGSGGAVPQARLWDVLSGREIMSIPVADINHYVWELEFDETGHRLTTLVLAKAWGTKGGWGSTVYDATPLGETEDAQLIATRLVEELQATTPLPNEVVDALKADVDLTPLVRDVAIERAKRIRLDPDTIADFTLPIVTTKNRPPADYQRALQWAKALHSVEPGSLRTSALLGGAQLRSGNFKDSLITLSDIPNRISRATGSEQLEFEFLARSLRVLALHQNGQQSVAREQASRLWGTFFPSDQTTRLTGGIFIFEMVNEINRLFPRNDRRMALSNARLPDVDRIDGLFATTDTTADGKLTEAEAAATPMAWSEMLHFDENRDSVIGRDEFRSAMKVFTRWRLAGYQLRDGLYEQAAKNLDDAVNLAPAYPASLNGRAWFRATCPDEKFRNGKQAVEDATKACESANWKNSGFLDTLAAALAESGDFANAIKRQEQALALANAVDKIDSQLRLGLYSQNKPFRTPIVKSLTSPTEQPLLTSEVVSHARRVAGWGACWSPDGKKLVRNLNFQSNHRADLEIIDLETGATTKLCIGGADPFWSPQPGGPIAFARGPEGEPRTPLNESIWLVNPDGSELRELGDGGFPSWANDGRLFYRRISGNDLHLIAKRLDREESASEASPIPGGLYPAISPDGNLVAVPTQSRLTIRDRVNKTDVASLELEFGNLVAAGWSPDGRYIAYGAYSAGFPGLWLWDFRAGTKSLLATEPLTMPRWSPDGKYTAADARALNEVVLLDVSRLNLSNGLPAVPSITTAEDTNSTAAGAGGNVQAAP